MANENENKTTFEECYLASYSEENRENSTPAELCSAKRNSMMLLHNETLNTLSNESTCFILKQNLFEYSQLMNENLKPDSKNSFTKSIDFLLKGKVQTRHCSSWRCSLRDSKIDTLDLLKNELVNSNHCNVNKNQACKNDEVSVKNLKQLFSERNLDDIEDELKKLDLPNTIRHCPKITVKNPHIVNTNMNKSTTTNVNQVLKNTPTVPQTMNRIDNDFPYKYQSNEPEITNNLNDNYNKYSFKNQSKSMTDQSNEFFNPGIRKSNSGDMNRYNQMKRNEPAPTENKSNFQFKTARTELMVQNMKKYGNAHQNIPQYQENVSAPKRSLGTTRSVGSKFIPPIMKSNEDFEETKMESETIQDERLKHIDPKMVELIMSEIIDSSAPIGWDDIAGLEFAKTAIQEAVVWPLLRPDIFTGLRRPPRGILLFGPPGTGKTLIGKCIASQCSATFFSISASSLTSKWLGDGEKMVRALFAVARCHQPAVVFIDEIDSLLTQRSDAEHEATRRIKTEFLVQLDGAAIGDEDRLLLIGATNRPQELDEAARRRLVKRLYIPLPDLAARKQIIKRLMTTERHCLTDDEVDEIAALADGFSGADMRSLCAEAALGPIRTLPLSQITNIHSDQVRPIIADDFKNALTRVRPSVSGNDLEHYIKWDKTYGSGNAR